MTTQCKALTDKQPRYGVHLSEPIGYIAEFECDESYDHRFGGSSWRVLDNKSEVPPILLLTLDLRDPKLDAVNSERLKTLPLCSHLNNLCWGGLQVFHINPDRNSVELIESEFARDEVLEEIYRLPEILPEYRLKLREMRQVEYPTDEMTYEQAVQSFTNDDAFLRVLGPPVWINWTQNVICECGSETKYVGSIGTEGGNGRRVFSDKYFFYGEGCLYFFFCRKCLVVAVISQGT